MRVLGIDTSLRATGLGVVDSEGSRLLPVAHTVIRSPSTDRLSAALVRLRTGIEQALSEYAPDAVSIEGAFFCRNVRTAMVLGEARGVAICSCSACGVPVFEYAPRRIKQAVVGFGAADKKQVRSMVMTLLGMAKPPALDASDAYAIALCHLNSYTRHPGLAGEPI